MTNPIINIPETKLDNFIKNNSDTAAGIDFARRLRKSIANRFIIYKNDPAYLLVTIIDTRFKTKLIESYKKEKAINYLTKDVENRRSTSDTIELEITEQNILPTKVPVFTNFLWDILQELLTSSTDNERLY